MLKCAFLISSGSNVHSTSSMPRCNASSRCANFSRRPTPWFRYSGRTPIMWLCRYIAPPFFSPGIASRKPIIRSPAKAPNVCPPTLLPTTNRRTGSNSMSSKPQISCWRRTASRNSSISVSRLTVISTWLPATTSPSSRAKRPAARDPGPSAPLPHAGIVRETSHSSAAAPARDPPSASAPDSRS
jgi:hypothetical protein